MYIYLYCMILSHISSQNYFKNFPKFRKIPIWNSVSGLAVDRAGRPDPFQAWPVDRPVDRALCPGRARFVHVCRSTDRSADWKQLALCFWPVDRVGRPIAQNVFPLWRPVDRPIDRVQRLVANRTAGRPGQSTGSSLQRPTALSPLVIFWFGSFFVGRKFWKFGDYF